MKRIRLDIGVGSHMSSWSGGNCGIGGGWFGMRWRFLEDLWGRGC